MKFPGEKCLHCSGYLDCMWRDEDDDTCWYEPDDYDGSDIGSASVRELEEQNL